MCTSNPWPIAFTSFLSCCPATNSCSWYERSISDDSQELREVYLCFFKTGLGEPNQDRSVVLIFACISLRNLPRNHRNSCQQPGQGASKIRTVGPNVTFDILLGKVGFGSKQRANFVESSLQSIASNSSLWKRTK